MLQARVSEVRDNLQNDNSKLRAKSHNERGAPPVQKAMTGQSSTARLPSENRKTVTAGELAKLPTLLQNVKNL